MKKEKGIALITLVVAILMMLIISSVIIFNTTSHIKMQNLNNMYNDINLLSEKVFLYYSKNKTLPIEEQYYVEADVDWRYKNYGNEDEEENRPEYRFYILDLNKIDKNLKTPTHSMLKYGEYYYDRSKDDTDVYIINETTHQIYYVKGVEMDKVLYYTIPDSENKYKDMYNTLKLDVNPPILEDGLTPIVLNGNVIEEVTDVYGTDWYSYTFGPNLSSWARAKGTSNEDLYMWIPRFTYKVEGTGDNRAYTIVFLKNTSNEAIDGTNVSGAEWNVPVVFTTRDGEELTGRWLSIGNDYKYINSHIDLVKYLYELNGKDNTQGSTNITITGGAYSYSNPIIPKGYKTIQSSASWVSSNGTRVDGWNKGNGWDEGLTIENGETGVQYIWVPIASTAEYDTWYTSHAANLSNFVASDLQNQINLYSGFYITKEKVNDRATILYLADEKDNRQGTENIKLGAGKFAYNNPVIPAGFRAIDTPDASWNLLQDGTVEGWNEGLVIQDTLENEYVWVPVDGENIKFEQHEYVKTAATEQSLNPVNIDTNNTADTGNGNWRTYKYRNFMDWKNMMVTGKSGSYYVYEDKMPERVASVNKYGGFYIARYEAGIIPAEDGVQHRITSQNNNANQAPVSKKNYVVWNRISQINAGLACNKLNDITGYSSVNAGLVDGFAWDAMMSWFETDGKSVTNSTGYGNHYTTSLKESNVIYYPFIYEYNTSTGSGIKWYEDRYFKNSGNTEVELKAVNMTTDAQKEEVKQILGVTTLNSGSTYRRYIELATGTAECTKVNNIYDLAGNMFEWTLEIGNHSTENSNQSRETQTSENAFAVLRGGSFGYSGSYPVCSRDGGSTVASTYINIGFRSVLYIK